MYVAFGDVAKVCAQNCPRKSAGASLARSVMPKVPNSEK